MGVYMEQWALTWKKMWVFLCVLFYFLKTGSTQMSRLLRGQAALKRN